MVNNKIMKIEINTTTKTILVKETIVLNELLQELQSMNIDLHEYSLVPYIMDYIYTYPAYNVPLINGSITLTP